MEPLASPTQKTRDRIHTPCPDSVDVAIIGAGLGGLMTGARLACNGKRVAVFDAHYVAGGCATMYSRQSSQGAFQFDIGLHYIGDCGAGGKIPTMLSSVGIDDVVFLPMDPDGFDTIVTPDFTFPIPADRAVYRDRLLSFFPHEVRAIDRYVRFLEEIDHVVAWMETAPRGRVRGMASFAWNIARHGRMVAKYQHATIAEVLDGIGMTDLGARAVVLGQSGDYGVPPAKASAMLHGGLANHYFRGAWYPQGGGQVLADRLAEVIEDHGGTVHLRHPVQSIRTQNGRANGVVVTPFKQASRSVDAAVVVSNADLLHTIDDLVSEADCPPAWKARRPQFEMGSAIFISCLGVETDLRSNGMRRANYWRFDTLDIDAVYAATAAGDMNPQCAYITSASLKDPDTQGHAPEGIMTLEVMTLASGNPAHWGLSHDDIQSGQYRKNATYLDCKKRVEDGLLRHVDALFPAVSGTVVFRESATPATHTRYTRAANGTGYGLAATPEQFLKSRPGHRSPLPGLYLAGANTRSGHGILGALTSGVTCATKVMKDSQPS